MINNLANNCIRFAASINFHSFLQDEENQRMHRFKKVEGNLLLFFLGKRDQSVACNHYFEACAR